MKFWPRLFVIILLFPGNFYAQSPARDSLTSNLLNTLDSIYTQVNKNYYRPVALDNFTRKGIDAMFSTLDPYSYYMSREEAEEFQIALSSKFGGTGIGIAVIDSQVTIMDVFKGFPAEKAGLKPADQILSVDELITKGQLDPVFLKLRGTPGSTVRVRVKRPGTDSIIETLLVREVITISSVPYYGMLNGETGYIRFTAVTEKCSDDILRALLELKKKGNMKNLVLDLRNNMGGYFKEAIRIANFFIEKGSVLVKARYRAEDSTYYASEASVDPVMPMVILINENTASSAEILSGALQDNDRAVVIGQKSFGKGLIGKKFSLGDGKETVLTIGFYYTPSGRCLQSTKRWTEFTGENNTGMVFKTKNGRIMKEEDGIIPDIETLPKKPSNWLNCLSRNNYYFKYATQYRMRHPAISSARNFNLGNKELEDFYTLSDMKNCDYRSESEEKLHELKKSAEAEGWATIPGVFDSLEKQIKIQKNKDLQEQRQEVKNLLEQAIVFRYYGEDGRIESGFRNDREITAALEVLKNKEQYKKILSGN